MTGNYGTDARFSYEVRQYVVDGECMVQTSDQKAGGRVSASRIPERMTAEEIEAYGRSHRPARFL